MKKITIALIFSLLTLQGFSWGGKGHAIIAQIAQENLSRKTEKRVTAILGGVPMAYYASWADDIRSEPAFRQTAPWHYANLEEGKSYADSEKNPAGDMVTAVEMLIAKLKEPTLNDSLTALYTKLLIHFMGDLHCPMHTGYRSNQGGNRFEVRFFNEKTSIHSVWDDMIVNRARPWSYTEWVDNIAILNKSQITSMVQGSPREWIEQTGDAFHRVYDPLTQGDNLSWGYMKTHWPTLEQQLQRGGYRLAAVLNDIFG